MILLELLLLVTVEVAPPPVRVVGDCDDLTVKNRSNVCSGLRRLTGVFARPQSEPEREHLLRGVWGDWCVDGLHSDVFSDCNRGDIQNSFAGSDKVVAVVVVAHPPTTDVILVVDWLLFSANFSLSWELIEESSFCFRIFVSQSTFSLSLRFGDWSCKCGASPLTTKLGRFEVGDANNDEALRLTYGDRNVAPGGKLLGRMLCIGGVSGEPMFPVDSRSENGGENSCLTVLGPGITFSARNKDELLVVDPTYGSQSRVAFGGVYSVVCFEVHGVAGDSSMHIRLLELGRGESASSRIEAKFVASRLRLPKNTLPDEAARGRAPVDAAAAGLNSRLPLLSMCGLFRSLPPVVFSGHKSASSPVISEKLRFVVVFSTELGVVSFSLTSRRMERGVFSSAPKRTLS